MRQRTTRHLIMLSSVLLIVACGGGGGGGASVGGGTTTDYPPAIGSQPFDEAVVRDSTAAFSVGVSGSCPITFRWQRNGVDIPGTTTSPACQGLGTYTVANVTEADSGAQFRAIVSNKGGSVTSATAVLTVISKKPRVPDTGIQRTQCYRAGSNVLVDCDSADAFALNPDQDGMRIEGFGFSFVGSNSIQDCVHDDVTGLTWEGKVYPPDYSRPNSRGILERTYTEALQYATYVNTIALCGYTDWRIPTLEEMLSIANYGMNPYLAFWLRGYDEGFWTSSSWSVGNGANGYPGITPTDATRTDVRLVRGRANGVVSPESRYTVSANQLEVTDNRTGLVWKRCPEGRTWDGKICFGALDFTHEAALAYARGSGGWRVPSIHELATIVPTPENPTVGSVLPLGQFSSAGGYWSSTPCVREISTDGARKSFSVRLRADGIARDMSCGTSPRDLTYYQIRLVK